MSFIILWQGVGLLGGAFAELTDAGISRGSRDKLLHALEPLVHRATTSGDATDGSRLLAIKDLRAKRAGSLIDVDVTVDVAHTISVLATSELEGRITQLLKDTRSEVSEVRVKFHPVENSSP